MLPIWPAFWRGDRPTQAAQPAMGEFVRVRAGGDLDRRGLRRTARRLASEGITEASLVGRAAAA
jgi:hypothetical protein